MSKKAAVQAVEQAPVPAEPDENAGKGGSYVMDPKTGKRTLVERTKDRDEEPEDVPAADASADKE